MVDVKRPAKSSMLCIKRIVSIGFQIIITWIKVQFTTQYEGKVCMFFLERLERVGVCSVLLRMYCVYIHTYICVCEVMIVDSVDTYVGRYFLALNLSSSSTIGT